MSLTCKCDECSKELDVNEDIICRKCYDELLDEILSLKERIKELED